MFTGGVVMNKNELLKVMIVDDEEMIRRGLRAIVDWKEYGYTVLL